MLPAAERRLVVTCEHGGNRVPPEHRELFVRNRSLLASHHGWDPGALSIARSLARALKGSLVAGSTTRLLVDLNRSPHNPAVFSELTRGLPRDQRERLLARYHRPHWDRVRAAVVAARNGSVHLAVHSFTPVLRGKKRDFEVGILYDPQRSRERAFARLWQQQLREQWPSARIRRNAPYRGDADGLTTALRRELPPDRYLGLELELNQRAVSTEDECRALATVLATTLNQVLRPPT